MFKRFLFIKKLSSIAIITFTLSSAGSFAFPNKVFYLKTEADIDYFKGVWKVTLRNNPTQSFSWTVKEDLNNSWLSGVVEQDTRRISTDFWHQRDKKIERFAFTGNSLFVKIESPGWEGDKMVLTGTMSDKTTETKIRETITRVSAKQFNALWEMEKTGGEWIVFEDEICSKINN